MLSIINKDIITAMKAKEELVVSTLRMAKTSLQNKEKDKQAPLEDAEAQSVLTTLIKQRRDSYEQFIKGGREELAAKEQAEIGILEKYLPREATVEELTDHVKAHISAAAETGVEVSSKLMGTVIKGVKDTLAGLNLRADGKTLSGLVQTELQKAGK